MSQASVKPIPEGMHTLTPALICAGASEAIDFYKKAFGATELFRSYAPDGGTIMHAQIRIGDSTVMLADESPTCDGMLGPKVLKGTPVSLYLYVENVDKMFDQAVSAGAKVVMPLGEMFWGDRWCLIEDPFGHRWHIATHTRDLTPQQIEAGMKEAVRARQSQQA